MTNTTAGPEANPAPAGVSQPSQQPKEKNVLGIIAFVISVVGFIFACIPGVLILGWVLLPIAGILAIVSFFLKGKGKALGVTALIVSVVGTIVGVIVFISVAATAFDDAFSGGETTAAAPDGEAGQAQGDGDQGTRENPYPIGTAVTQGDWTVTVNSVDTDATDDITAENLLNEDPDAGTVYILVNVTAAYNGANADGETPWTSIAYVTSDGKTIDGTDKLLVAPEAFDSLTTLYEGASVTGNLAFQVPADTASEGALAVTPTMMGDKVFVAVK